MDLDLSDAGRALVATAQQLLVRESGGLHPWILLRRLVERGEAARSEEQLRDILVGRGDPKIEFRHGKYHLAVPAAKPRFAPSPPMSKAAYWDGLAKDLTYELSNLSLVRCG